MIDGLGKFVKHDNAARLTRKDIMAWRDHLKGSLAARTISDVHLSTVRSLLNWAVENERLSENVAATVKQPKPRKTYGRERGYTDAEAVQVLKASRSYQPKANEFGYVRETEKAANVKRWVPILCAFTGARVSEITQLSRHSPSGPPSDVKVP